MITTTTEVLSQTYARLTLEEAPSQGTVEERVGEAKSSAMGATVELLKSFQEKVSLLQGRIKAVEESLLQSEEEQKKEMADLLQVAQACEDALRNEGTHLTDELTETREQVAALKNQAAEMEKKQAAQRAAAAKQAEEARNKIAAEEIAAQARIHHAEVEKRIQEDVARERARFTESHRASMDRTNQTIFSNTPSPSFSNPSPFSNSSSIGGFSTSSSLFSAPSSFGTSNPSSIFSNFSIFHN